MQPLIIEVTHFLKRIRKFRVQWTNFHFHFGLDGVAEEGVREREPQHKVACQCGAVQHGSVNTDTTPRIPHRTTIISTTNTPQITIRRHFPCPTKRVRHRESHYPDATKTPKRHTTITSSIMWPTSLTYSVCVERVCVTKPCHLHKSPNSQDAGGVWSWDLSVTSWQLSHWAMICSLTVSDVEGGSQWNFRWRAKNATEGNRTPTTSLEG